MKPPTEETSAARLLGAKGGRATAAKLTPEQLKDRGRKAIAARWAKSKVKKETDAKAVDVEEHSK